MDCYLQQDFPTALLFTAGVLAGALVATAIKIIK